MLLNYNQSSLKLEIQFILKKLKLKFKILTGIKTRFYSIVFYSIVIATNLVSK